MDWGREEGRRDPGPPTFRCLQPPATRTIILRHIIGRILHRWSDTIDFDTSIKSRRLLDVNKWRKCRNLSSLIKARFFADRVVILMHFHTQQVQTSLRLSPTTLAAGTSAATTVSRMNLFWYVGHVTIFSRISTTACCLEVGLGLELVSGWIEVMHTYLYYFPLSFSLSHCLPLVKSAVLQCICSTIQRRYLPKTTNITM